MLFVEFPLVKCLLTSHLRTHWCQLLRPGGTQLALSRYCGRATISWTHLVLATGDVHPPGRSPPGGAKNCCYPLVICYITIEHGPYIVDLPNLKMVISIAMLNYQRVFQDGWLPFGKLTQTLNIAIFQWKRTLQAPT